MDTTRNRSKVLAQSLRAALSEIRSLGVTAFRYRVALLSIDTVADELEAVAAGRDLPLSPAPDPDATTNQEGGV